jgi:hypothetical protein
MTTGHTPVRIAMWSGPRNISTAMMRAWENRADTAVCDEPLYGHYLLATGLDHPGRDEVIASQATDWRAVVAALTGPIPDGKAISYQKHMAHHLLPVIERGWLDRVVNCFLIRRPEEVLASYVRTRDDPTLADLGFAQQGEIFERVCERTGRVPPILDARDVLEHPRKMLTLLCAAVGVPFSESMLSWPAGRRDSDGVWAKYWYAGVERSTGFAPYRPPGEPLADRLRPLADACEPYYRRLYDCRLVP